MWKQKLSLSLLFSFITLLFLASGSTLEPLFFLLLSGGVLLLCCCFCPAISMNQTFSHDLPMMLLPALLVLSAACMLPTSILSIFVGCAFLLYEITYLLLLLLNRAVALLQKVPGTGLLILAGICIAGGCVAAVLLSLSFRNTILSELAKFGLMAFVFGILPPFLDLYRPDRPFTSPILPMPLPASSFLPYLLIKLRPPHSKKFQGSIPSDAEILIHVADTKYGKLGHTDFCFDGTVLSFGGYDASTHRLDGMFGEGMIFFAPDKEKYLNFCRSYSKKTIFGFGIRLTEEQKARLKEEIRRLSLQASPWAPDPHSPSDYAYQLARSTGAQFFKFNQGRWKTYFILKNNCTQFCNHLFRPLEIGRSNPILTPGYYYGKLNQAWRQGNGFVVSKEIYAYEEVTSPQASSTHLNKQQRTG